MVASITDGGSGGIGHRTLFDFTRIGSDNASSPTLLWTENSDTTKSNTGSSKASLVIQNNRTFQRAVLFTLLNPMKSRGIGYAAVECETNFHLSGFINIAMRCRAQGVNVHYKMILRHKGCQNNSLVYGQVFTAPIDEFATVKLPFANFKPYYRGQELSLQDNPLDQTAITNVALKIDNGTYLPDNQVGVAALEIDWIKATK